MGLGVGFVFLFFNITYLGVSFRCIIIKLMRLFILILKIVYTLAFYIYLLVLVSIINKLKTCLLLFLLLLFVVDIVVVYYIKLQCILDYFKINDCKLTTKYFSWHK